MKRLAALECLCWLTAASAVGWLIADPGVELVVPTSPARHPAVSRPDRLSATAKLRWIIAYTIEANPFGESDDIPSNGAPSQSLSGLGSPIGRIPLGGGAAPRLAGVAGPPWSAVLTGISSAPQVTVAVRDTVGGYRVLSISSDYVVLRGRDTTLKLALSGVRQ